MSTEDLQSIEGIGETTAEKLIAAGIPTPVALAATTVAKLVAIGMSKSSAQKILNLARERCSEVYGFVSGEELINQFKRREFLTSGTSELDRILGGKGFETQKVYEIYGPEGTGKSNLLHQLICTAYLPPDQGGLGAGTVYIDTEGTFSIKRVQDLAPRFGIDPQEISRNVIKAGPPTSDSLLFICETQLENIAHQNAARFFCLDSIASHFRSEYGSERQQLPERQQKANKIIHALKRVVQQTNGVALLTNQVSANVTGQGKKYFHSMGNVVGHESQVRILIRVRNTAQGIRELKIEKALDLPPDSCFLKLTETGFSDVKTKVTKKLKIQPKPGGAQKTAPASDADEEEDEEVEEVPVEEAPKNKPKKR